MIIDGKQLATELSESLKEQAGSLNLRLAGILVGNDPEFEKFVQLKAKSAQKIGIEFPVYQFPSDINTEELVKRVTEISNINDGVLVELPLPGHIDAAKVLNAIPVEKDVDVLSDKAQELFYNDQSKISPPAVEALKIILEKYGISPTGRKAAVFGQGILVGKPVSHWLEREGAEVYRINSKTENPGILSGQADIVVAGVGKPGLITGDMVKEGAVVIDFGYGKKDGKMKGDADYDSVSPRTSLITPVPGGIGPVLVEVVLKNLITLNKK